MKYRIFFTIPSVENLFYEELKSLDTDPMYFGTELYIDLEASVGVNLMTRGKTRIASKLREVLGFDVDSIAITGIIILA